MSFADEIRAVKSYEELRPIIDKMSDRVAEWQGLPVSLGEDQPLVLHDRHPWAPFYKSLEQNGGNLQVLRGGPELGPDEDEEVVNSWYDGKHNRRVWVFRRLPSRKAFALVEPIAPDRSMERLTFWLQTLGCADAWMEEAEAKARKKLRRMLSDRQWHQYDMTGSFLETSPRSRISYLFRRLRPTVALSPRWPEHRRQLDSMRCLAVLCLHPIGYYEGSWAGCLTPSDDVIAHLTMVRGDEAHFWAKANQHEPWDPGAGL